MTEQLKQIVKDAELHSGEIYVYLCADYTPEQTAASREIFRDATEQIKRGLRQKAIGYGHGIIDSLVLTKAEIKALDNLASNELSEKDFTPSHLSVDMLTDEGDNLNLGVWLGRKDIARYPTEFLEDLLDINLVIIGIKEKDHFKKLKLFVSRNQIYQEKGNDIPMYNTQTYRLPKQLQNQVR